MIPASEIEKCVRAYVAAIGTDVRLAATYYEEPAIIVGPESFLLLQSKAEVVNFLDSLLAPVRPLGYAKSTCDYLSVKMLNAAMALCSTITARRKADGTELQRRGSTYLLRNRGAGWKIRQLMVTDLDKLL